MNGAGWIEKRKILSNTNSDNRDDQKLSSFIDLLAGVRAVVINESKENELLRNDEEGNLQIKDLSLDPYWIKKLRKRLLIVMNGTGRR